MPGVGQEGAAFGGRSEAAVFGEAAQANLDSSEDLHCLMPGGLSWFCSRHFFIFVASLCNFPSTLSPSAPTPHVAFYPPLQVGCRTLTDVTGTSYSQWRLDQGGRGAHVSLRVALRTHLDMAELRPLFQMSP